LDSKERFGRFVLQHEDARTSAGSFYRAVQLGPEGYERHVQVFRSEPMAENAAEALADGLKKGLEVQHAQIVRGFEAGSIGPTAFAVFELVEGRSVGSLIERSRAEGHPFATDHALLIASKAAAALEAGQAKKRIHGFLIPEFVQVSHDGEVTVRAFGLLPRLLREANCVGLREAGFLAPEAEAMAPLDIRADVFSLGAQLFEMLTGQPLPRNQPSSASILGARIQSPGADGTPLPKALGALLLQALVEDKANRFKDASAFKKAVDTLLFSGDYSPTTFNLAFFMHTLFRDEGDEDAARLKAERNADYRPYLAPSRPTGGLAPSDSTNGVPPASSGSAAPPAASGLTPTAAIRSEPAVRVESSKPEVVRGDAVRNDAPRHDPTRAARAPAIPTSQPDVSPQAAVVGQRAFPVAPVAIGVVAVIAIAIFAFSRVGPSTPAPVTSPTMNAAESAALARVRELETRLAALESEKQAAEQKAAEEAKALVEARAKARGRAVDPKELQRAQDEARRKAQVDQESRLAAERQKIDDERKRAEEARAPEVSRPEGTPAPVAPPSVAPSAAPSAAAPVSSPAALPAPAEGTPSATPASAAVAPASSTAPLLLDLSDPGVTAPQLVSQPRVDYPPMARAQRITGTVLISALVDEQGSVAETRIIRGAMALNQAALDSVKRRKYRPATRNGKPGRIWIAVSVEFKL
jgi:TonB family protein